MSQKQHQVPDKALYRKIFDVIDADKSQAIDQKELEGALGKIGIKLTSAQIKGMINLMDMDDNQQLEFGEFCQFFYVCQNADLTNNASVLFFAADADFSNNINKEELLHILKKININPTQTQLEAMMKQVADKETGNISYEQFMKFIKLLTGK